MALLDALAIIILVLDFVLSIWNSYASGFNLGMVQRSNGPRWLYVSSIVGLALGLVGEVYVLAIVIGVVARLRLHRHRHAGSAARLQPPRLRGGS